MNKDPYATAEESASVMAKNVTPERKAAIERLEEMIGERGLDEHGVSDTPYARGLYEIALELAERNSVLLDACEAFLQYDQGDQEDGIALMISYNDALTKCQAAVSENKP